jgi:signal transduction histidine kinase
VIPIPSNRPLQPAGVLVAGVSARLKWDESYRGFLELVTAPIATAIANARAYEEEKRRAESLAELDRAKTAFFANVSHEFRTPLTLILGPVEDLLAHGRADLPAATASQLEVVHRNGLRLLRLVNTLLDFSRIEAGRVRAVYRPTDLAAFTADLASMFRAAVERAGLRLVVDCPKLSAPVFVDRDMWEKIVLNLLSNAFKFTFDGEIAVTLRQTGQAAELQVRDTGTGIPPKEMPRLFERFHRIQNARGRTHEGSGIGLSLVQELVKLHGGSVTADSVLHQGTTFTVTVPLGSAHLPSDQIGGSLVLAPTATGTSPYVNKALRWLPDEKGEDARRSELPNDQDVLPLPYPRPAPREAAARPRVLVADDNADMRQYLVRLLAGQYQVMAVPDGMAALAAASGEPPDLVLSDVMMPGLDGFGLLKELRADPGTRDVPVIMLSARAGEESRIEGIDAGADDYLVKPFSARELRACVSARLQIAQVRRQTEQALREADQKKDEFLGVLAHELRNPLAPIRNGLQIMKLAKNDAVAAEQARGMMERQLNQMVHLIDDLMDLTRISRGMITLQKTRMPIAAAVRDAVESSRPLIEQQGHDLTLDVPDEPIYVDADETRLSQVIANLLNNAAKYTNRGGCIRLAVERRGNEVAVGVEDNGVGIPAHMLPTVFDMFTQVDRSLEKAQGGLGIGLTIVKRLVEIHGGTIAAESGGHGMGSRFIVRLPVVLALASNPPGGEAGAQTTPSARRRILVVDDNRDAALSLAIMLKIMGNDTQTAHDGLEALDVAAAFRPEVILLDIGMPKLNGYETARRIRQEPWGRSTVLVALTGWGQEEDKRQSREADFDLHMVKPIEPMALDKLLAGLQVQTA